MAQNNQNVRQSFFEVVFHGKPKVVRAFLTGLLMGAGRQAYVFYSFDEGIHHDGKTERLAEMVGIRATACHVVVDADTSAYLKKMAKRIVAETGLEIASHRSIRSASMAFSYHAYAAKYDQDIVALVKNLPAGLKLQGFKHDVRLDPSAKGLEAYAATHDFDASGAGTITGGIDLLIALKRRLADFPLIAAEDIVLKLA